MTEGERSAGSNGGRRRKRFLSPSQKYEIWLALGAVGGRARGGGLAAATSRG